MNESGGTELEHPDHAAAEAPTQDASRIRPFSGEIIRVVGRGTPNSPRGLAPLHEVTLRGEDGQTMEIVRSRSDPDVPIHVLAMAPPFTDFGCCPICLTRTGDFHREHVPQAHLGGHEVSRTCQPCNNLLGSRIETELLDWFDDAVWKVNVRGGPLRGRRHVSRLLLRETPTGDLVAIPEPGRNEGNLGAAIHGGGPVELGYTVPRPHVYKLAALKHAYLATCVLFGAVPRTTMAQQVRAALLAARDAPRGQAPVSELATRLAVPR